MSAQIDMMDAGVMDRPQQPVITPRPTRTDEMTLKAAQAFIAEVSTSWGITHADEHAQDLAKYWRPGMDGYQLAKTLDDRCYWEITSDMVEELEGFEWKLRDLVKSAEQEWVKAFDIQPPHPLGTVVSTTRRDGRQGIIDEVCTYSPATYLIKPCEPTEAELRTKSRWCVRFEDATPVADDGVLTA